MEKKQENRVIKHSGISFRTLSHALCIIGIILFLLTALQVVMSHYRYQKLLKAVDNCVLAEQYVNELLNGSDKLTSMSQKAVATCSSEPIKEYFNEVYNIKSRERAISNIQTVLGDSGQDAFVLLEEAMSVSNDLMTFEVHAMALVSHLDSFSGENTPAEIRNYSLNEKEMELDDNQLFVKAISLVNGEAYYAKKSHIEELTAAAIVLIQEDVREQEKNSRDEFEVGRAYLTLLIILSFILLVVLAITIERLLLKPIRSFDKCLSEEKLLPPCKSRELNNFAYSYNRIFENNANTKISLQKKAEHDSLTGLMNRAGFEALKEFYKNGTEPMAFIIIDVDRFKEINDEYGHEVGDKALVRVANLLSECFRSNDYPIRYGGDEFAVLMSDIKRSQIPIIERKLEYINNELLNHEVEGIPKFSLSVGIALSDKGFPDDLVRHADDALYTTKQNGRCGFTFYEENEK